MDFSWDDERHIHPVWSERAGESPTIEIPSSQKNGRSQVIPMLPGLQALLESVPKDARSGWVANPLSLDRDLPPGAFRPGCSDLERLVRNYSNRSIAKACGVTDTAVRKWLEEEGIRREQEFHSATTPVPDELMHELRDRPAPAASSRRKLRRPCKDHVSRVISQIGEHAGIIVRLEDERKGTRRKYASAHDLRRGCAQRLINAGISAETLKLILRHKDFATTEKFYGAMRSAQAAAKEVQQRLANFSAENPSLVGGLVGGKKEAPQLSSEELRKLKALLNSL